MGLTALGAQVVMLIFPHFFGIFLFYHCLSTVIQVLITAFN